MMAVGIVGGPVGIVGAGRLIKQKPSVNITYLILAFELFFFT